MSQPETGFSVIVATSYPELAEQVLDGLERNGRHSVACILTLTSRLDEIGSIAERRGIPIVEIPIPTSNFRIDRTCDQDEAYRQKIEAAAERIKHEISPEILLTFGFPMLPPVLLETPSRGAINIHPADLPAYRGMNPLEAMVLDGARSMRVTVHHLSVKIDEGDVIAKSEVIPIPAGARCGELWQHVLDGVAVRLIVTALDALWNGDRPDQAELAYTPTDGDRIPDAIGLKTVEVRDPSDGTMKRTNVGVLGKVRIEWMIDTAEELERASRAFDGGMHGGVKLFTDYRRRTFLVDDLVTLEAPPLEEAIIPGTILDVIDESTVVCATVDRKRIQLSGRFRTGIANIEPPVLEAGEAFESTTPIALQTGLPMQGLERTVLVR